MAVARRILVLAGFCAGCEHPSSDAGFDRLSVDPCRTHQCETFHPRDPGDPPYLVKGAAFEVGEFWFDCRIDVSWLVHYKESERRFHAMVVVRKSDVFPLRDGLVQLSYCQSLRLQVPASQPYAVVVLNPDAVNAPALAPNDVFIPLRGDAVLDDSTYARVQIDPQPDGSPASPSVTVFLSSQPPHPNPGFIPKLREGDTFPWGDAEAKIVRIAILPEWRYPVGWIEVSLSVRATPRDARP